MLEDDSFVFKHDILSSYEVEISLLTLSSSILLKFIKDSTSFVIVRIKELTGRMSINNILVFSFINDLECFHLSLICSKTLMMY